MASKRFNLLDVAEISGSTVTAFDGERKYVATGDVDTHRIVGGTMVTHENRPSRANLTMGRDEVLFAKMKATIKVLAGSPEIEEAIFSTGFYILKPTKQILRDYLYFYLLSADFNRQKDMYSSGATMAGLGNTGLQRITISLPVDGHGDPDLKEQERIVALLQEVEALKKKRSLANQKTSGMIPALFDEMFGDSLTNPLKWEIVQLKEAITYLTSGARGWAKYYVPEPGYRYLRIQNVKNAMLHLAEIQYVQPPESAEAKRIKVQSGDLLISITADLGRTAVVDPSTAAEGAYINQHLALVRLDDTFNPVYVAHYIESSAGSAQLLRYGQAASKKGLNFNSIESLRIPRPPIEMQNEFAEKVKSILALEEKQKESAMQIQSLYSSLLSKSFV